MQADRTPIDLPLGDAGTTFIEASAGTGKTRAITTLVARLIVERGWRLDQILVVTFTRAATAELRDRIRRTLGGALATARSRAAMGAAAGESAPRKPGSGAADPFRGFGASDAAGTPPGPAVHASGKSREPEGSRESREPEHPGAPVEREKAEGSRESRELEHSGAPVEREKAEGSREPEGSRESREPEHPGAPVEREKAEGDSQVRELVAAWEREDGVDLGEAARRLEAALHDIDRAGICTIHGFCQRALADLAFESGFPFGFEVSGSGVGMVAAAVRDFWRRRLYPASILLVRHAFESGFLPSELAEWTSRRRAGVAEVRGGEPLPEPIEEREAAWRREFEVVRTEWEQHRETFRNALLDGDWLNRRSYGRNKVDAELDRIEMLFAAAEPRLPPPELAGRYGRKRLSESVKKRFALPEHPLFDAFDRLEEASDVLRSACDQWLLWARRDMLDEVRASVRHRVREDRRLGYDDLLSELGDALAGSHGERLAARIRHEYPCALIDEFQDTNPVQAAIFTRVYGEGRRDAKQDTADPMSVRGGRYGGGHRGAEQDAAGAGGLFVVGDPKQSIYRFRGADVYAYLAARRPVREHLALGQNWRSVPALVEAVNAVFAAPDAFVIPGIPYHPVAAARPGGNPLRIVPGSDGGGAPFESPLGVRASRPQPAVAEAAHPSNLPPGSAGVSPSTGGDGGGAPFELPPGSAGVSPATGSDGGGTPFELPSGSAGVSPATGGGRGGAPFEFRLLPDPEEAGKHRTKESANRIAAGAAANEIARLLAQATRGEAAIDAESLTGADVAVLVRTRAQGRLIAEALRARGVRSVEIDDRSVFETDEAEQVERLLWVLAEPGREARVRGALAGALFGLDAVALHALDEDEAAWSGWAERIAGWRSDWEARGIGPVLLKLLDGEGGAERLLARPGGVRRLTNFRHLADLLQEAETGGRLAPVELAVWLSRCRSAGTGGRAVDESAQLRLESDEALVRILTVHAAKGLEFPIVFCPFAWDARGRRDQGDVTYHLGGRAGYREILDLDPDERARSIAWVEEFSESVRLLYVALTRAKYRCVVTWGQVRGAEHAPLAWLLHRTRPGSAPSAGPGGGSESGLDAGGTGGGPEAGPGGGEPDDGSESGVEAGGAGGEPESSLDALGASGGPKGGPGAEEPDDGSESGAEAGEPDAAVAALAAAADRFRGLSASDWRGEVEAFARRLPDAIRVTVLETDPSPVRVPAFPEGPPPVLAAREPGRPLRRIRQLTSFTALSAEAFAAGSVRPAIERDDAEVDRPDHDQREEPADDTGEDTVAAGGAGRGRTAFTFPRGPVAGSCLHRIFERLDESPGIGPPDKPDLDTICRETLEDFGIDGEWSPVARVMVERTRAVRLHEAVHLHEREWEGPDGDAGSDERAAGSTGSADSGQGAPTRTGVGSKWEAGSGGGAGSTGSADSGQGAPPTRTGAGSKWEAGSGGGADSTGSADLGQGAGTRKGVGSKWEADAGGEADSDAEPGSGEGVDSNGADGGGSGGAGGFRLDDPAIRRLAELEFHFPVEGLDRERLAARLVEHGYPHPFARPVRDEAGERLPPIHGFLRGYVDLVVEHAGRWYILDYKSNWLGPAPADYAPEALAEAVRAGGYPLQYLVYLIALHRYLATRLPGYDYERHVGGAFYLFVRGIDPAAGMSRGVYFDRPAAACLHALDECFRGGVT